jgi:dienelactone hydrolase
MRILALWIVGLISTPALGQDETSKAKGDADPRKMLHSYLLAEAQKHFDARREIIAKLQSPDDIKKRQEYLKGKFIEALGGFPEKTPLNAKVVGKINANGFRVEKVIYESRPEHHVTANFYVPDGKGPFPGVLMPCGHSANGKAAEAYQRVCILLAQHGMAVLCYDPIGQGERSQLLDKMGKPAIAGSTSEHTMVGIGALLVGQSTATYRIWDGIRSLDYLASRPEVDPKRLGCTGNSGGGTLTAYLMALDDRIVCAAPSCYLTTLERLFATIGPQDAEQNITGQVAFGMEHADYILMRAPKPTLMCVATQDFFDIGGAKTTFKEASDIYKKLGAEEKMAFFEYDDKHGFSKPRREAAVRWLKRWLVGVDEPIKEGDFPVFKDEELQCTRSGQVLEDFKGKSAFQLSAAEAKRRSSERVRFVEAPHYLEPVRKLLGLPPDWPAMKQPPLTNVEPVETKERYTIHRFTIETEPTITLRGVWYNRGVGKGKLIFYLPEYGINNSGTPPRSIDNFVRGGREVFAIELRGLGASPPTAANAKPNYFGNDFKQAFLALHLNRPLLGQRFIDFNQFLRSPEIVKRLQSPDIEGLHFIGEGVSGLVALHTAALTWQGRGPVEVTLDRTLISWDNVAQTPISYNQLSGVVPGVLRVYDLPELAATLAPSTLTIRNTVDCQQRPVSQEELESAYSKCRESYARRGAKDKLVLQAEK